MTERQTKPKRAATPLERTLLALGALPPNVDEISAIRAMTRGTATAPQCRRGMAYIMTQLCGVGTVPFTGEATHGTAFRAGSLGVGIAIAQIGDAVLMAFSAEYSSGVHGDDETPPS